VKRRPLAVVAALLLALSCSEPYPSIGGAWRFASTLTYPSPSDWDVAPGQPYVCDYQAVLTISQSSGTFAGTYDSLATSCNSGLATSGGNGTVLGGALDRSGILSFDFDASNWLHVGVLHGDSMGGTVTDSVSSLSGVQAATGTWSACKGRVCR
jgi:hypothetical protein